MTQGEEPPIITILYVDDEPGLLEIGKLFLEDMGGFCVDTVTSARAALDILKSTPYDAIISDYQMPGLDGIGFLKLVRESSPDIPFVLFTGRGREEVVIEAINVGADFYLQKGGDPTAQFAELAHKIRQAVTRHRALDELREAYGKLKQNQEEIQAAYSELAANEQVLMHDYAALRESEEQYRTLFESADDAIFIMKDEKFIRCNRRTPEIFGYADTSEILGHSPDEFSPVHQPDGNLSADLVATYNHAVLEGAPRVFEWVFLHRDGTPFYTDVSLNKVELGGETYIQAIVRDITDRKHAEQAEALAARKLSMMQEFSRHEFTNTITGLLGLVDMARAISAGPEQDRLFLEMNGRVDLLRKQVAFTKEYQEVGIRAPRWQEIRGMLPACAQLDLVVLPAIESIEIYADPLVAKIFSYLAENVVKHGERATKIMIAADLQGSALRIVVADNGVGIPDEMKSAIFVRQIGETRGMGLFLISEILAITGITIAETGSSGEGARFEIMVPEGGFRFAKTAGTLRPAAEVAIPAESQDQ